MPSRSAVWLVCVSTLVVSLHSTGAPAQSAGARTTREGDYEVTRWQVKQGPPEDSVGHITTDYETREGVSGTDAWGNSVKATITVGGFVKKCPTSQGKAEGTFTYSLKVEEVNTDGGETQRRSYIRGYRASRITGDVNDDAKLTRIHVEGDLFKGDGSPPVSVPFSFSPDESGQPDWGAMRSAVELTRDLSLAVAIWFAAPNFREAEVAWKNKPCLELRFEPPSNSVQLGPNESTRVRVKLVTKRGNNPVAGATLDANRLEGRGTVAPRTSRTDDDGSAEFTYTAPAERRPPRGLDVVAMKSRAGVGFDKWYVTDALKLTIEHRIVSRRDYPRVRVGGPIYDGTVRFELQLEPFLSMPGDFRGETTVVRQFSVGHITPRCAGQGTQAEEWRVDATVDPNTETLQLRLAMFPDEMTAWWICDGQRSEVTVPLHSESNLDRAQAPLSMSSRSGSRQTFTPSSPEYQETLTVTIP